MSTDGTEVMLHIEHYDTLFPPVMTLEEDENNNTANYPFQYMKLQQQNSIV